MAVSSLFSQRPKRLLTPRPLGLPDVTNGLVLWYNGAGNAARDLSGRNNGGKLGTTTTFAPSPFGNAFVFDGTVNSAVTCPAAANISVFTYATWLWRPGTASAVLIGPSAATGPYVYSTGNNLWLGSVLSASSVLKVGVWQHIAVTYNAATGACVLYVNGKSAATGTTTASYSFGGVQTLGASVWGGTFSLDRMADVRIYNRQLTPAEISAIYFSGLTPALDGGLPVFRSPRALSLPASAGSFAVAGEAANAALVEPIAGFGAVGLTGFAAMAALGLPAAAGALTLTGFGLTAALVEPIAGFGAFAATGAAATLSRSRGFPLAQGAFAWTGASVAMAEGRRLSAAAAAFAWTGAPLQASAAHTLAAAFGAFPLAGFSLTAALVEPIVGFAAFALTGSAAGLRPAFGIFAAGGAGAWTGAAVSFAIGAAPPATLTADGGAVALTGGAMRYAITLEAVGAAKFSWRTQAVIGIVAQPAHASFIWKV